MTLEVPGVLFLIMTLGVNSHCEKSTDVRRGTTTSQNLQVLLPQAYHFLTGVNQAAELQLSADHLLINKMK
jgi:hypothetical protein